MVLLFFRRKVAPGFLLGCDCIPAMKSHLEKKPNIEIKTIHYRIGFIVNFLVYPLVEVFGVILRVQLWIAPQEPGVDLGN